MTAAEAPLAGDVARDFIAEELASERGRKASLEARGLAVITTSGTLVTLTLALAAVITEASDFSPSALTRWLLGAAAAFFVLAAAGGILSNSPAPYYRVEPESLSVFMTAGVWVEEGTDAKRELTTARLIELQDARARNERKARIVALAMGLQGVAVLCTAAAVVGLLLES
jgi:hypothetical protein